VSAVLWVLLTIHLHDRFDPVDANVGGYLPAEWGSRVRTPRLHAWAKAAAGGVLHDTQPPPSHTRALRFNCSPLPSRPRGFAGAPRDIEARASMRGRRCDTLYISLRALDPFLITRQAPTYTSHASRDLSMCPPSHLRVLHCTAPS
jgi:hypothetical protein